MPALLAAGAKAGWPRAAKPLPQDEASSADGAMAALADAGARALRAVPTETALPPGAAAAPPDPSATVARCEAMLRYGVAPAGLQPPAAAWEVMLNDSNSIPMTLRAQRSEGGALGVLGTAPQPAWTLTISTPALSTSAPGTSADRPSALSAPASGAAAFGTPVVDAAMLQRHLPRLLERLKTHAMAPGHVRIEAEDNKH